MWLRGEGLLLLHLALCTITDHHVSSDAWTVPSLRDLSIQSVNMRHILSWRPLEAACSVAVVYSVQYQGEFERQLDGSWLDAPQCQRTPQARCDLTRDLGSDSDYAVRVRARCGPRDAAWVQLSQNFNRRDTLLTVPDMVVVVVGDTVQLSFQELPPTASVHVTFWMKGKEVETSTALVPVERTPLLFSALQEGAVYCAQAQTYLDPQHHSHTTDTHCVSVTGPDAPWRTPTALALALALAAGVLLVVFWSFSHRSRAACRAYFHKEALPLALQSDWPLGQLVICEEAELCEPLPASLLRVLVNMEPDGHAGRGTSSRKQPSTPL